MKKRTIDIISLIGILIMLFACWLLYQEEKSCNEPFEKIITPLIEKIGYNISYATLTIYDADVGLLPIETYAIYINQEWVDMNAQTIKHDIDLRNINLNISKSIFK